MRFLRGAVKACRSGVRRCHLISYQEDGALLQELFSRDGIGTQIVMESAEQIRRATINDIGGILELIRPLEQQGILVRRSREQLEMEIDKFTIIQRDNTTIACAALYPFPEEKIGGNGLCGSSPGLPQFITGRGSAGTHCRSGEAERLKQIVCADHAQYSLVPGTWIYPRWILIYYPRAKKQLYNYQRKSKVLMADLGVSGGNRQMRHAQCPEA